MIIHVKLFARASDLAGTSQIEVELPEGATVSQFRQALVAQCPKLEPISKSLFVAIGNDYAQEEDIITSTSEVACFPPVSGG